MLTLFVFISYLIEFLILYILPFLILGYVVNIFRSNR